MTEETITTVLAGEPKSETQVEVEVAVPEKPVADLIDIEHFAKVKLRVAEVLRAEPLPKSKKLVKLQVTLGEKLGERQILAGISQYYTPDQLVGRKIIVVANLKPAKLMGEQSQGMLLAASTEDGALALLAPETDIAVGAEVR